MWLDRLKKQVIEVVDEFLRTPEEIDAEAWRVDDDQAEFEAQQREKVVNNPQNQPAEVK